MTSQDQRERDEAAQAYQGFYDEALQEPMRYLVHDVRSHDDEALYRLVNRHGMAFYGLYWLFAELLAARRNHTYDVSDDAGWRRLSADMSCMSDMSADECRAFVSELYDAGLIDRQYFDELKQVSIKRIRKSSCAAAEASAMKRLGAWKTNRKKLLG